MRQAQIKHIKNSDAAAMYTIQFVGDELTEFEKFIMKFRDVAELKRDYQIILLALQKILQNGILERYFRYEGKQSDGVCALPIYSGKLRLYCLRLSDKILIIGNGGFKNTRTYNESQELSGYVVDLQLFDRVIKSAVKKGEITIEETLIDNIENKIFDL